MFNSGNSRKSSYSQVPYHDYSSDDDSDCEEDDFIQQQIRTQKQQLRQQDEGLEMLSQSARRLGELSLGISEELGEQNKMLDRMENDLDRTTNTLHFITARTKDLISRSGGKKNFIIIVCLTLVA